MYFCKSETDSSCPCGGTELDLDGSIGPNGAGRVGLFGILYRIICPPFRLVDTMVTSASILFGSDVRDEDDGGCNDKHVGMSQMATSSTKPHL